LANLLLVPRKIVTGSQALADAGKFFKELGSKALIVTDNVMVDIGNIAKLTNILDSNDMEYAIYSGVNGEPSVEMVDEGGKVYKDNGCDCLIGVGGGSPIDAAKAIGAMINNPGNIVNYMGREICNPLPPLAAVPTTAGTGSEATPFTIITDNKNNVKMLLKGAVLLPVLAVIDPDLSASSPSKVTAATGIDALTHAIEAYTSRKAQLLTDNFALSACKRIFIYLRRAYQNGGDIEARTQMAIAALEAGIAFANASVTIVHGMSRPIGALFHVPHGVSNAMLLVTCLNYAKEGASDRFADIAKTVGLCNQDVNSEEAVDALVKEVQRLCLDINIPTLRQFGINKEKFISLTDKMATDALNSGSPANTLRQPSKEDIICLYKKLWD
jgi:Alcohol dehydrogenase, class IV